jgi:hypothetical protein
VDESKAEEEQKQKQKHQHEHRQQVSTNTLQHIPHSNMVESLEHKLDEVTSQVATLKLQAEEHKEWDRAGRSARDTLYDIIDHWKEPDMSTGERIYIYRATEYLKSFNAFQWRWLCDSVQQSMPPPREPTESDPTGLSHVKESTVTAVKLIVTNIYGIHDNIERFHQENRIICGICGDDVSPRERSFDHLPWSGYH